MTDLQVIEGGGPTSQIIPAIILAAQDIGPIMKEFNQSLGYSIRGWERVLNQIRPHLLSYGLIVTADDLEVTYRESNGLPKVLLKCQCTLWHDSSETITQTVYASHAEWIRRSNGQLTAANNNPEGAARTYAQRYFICRVFSIPTEATPETTDSNSSPDPEPQPDPEPKVELPMITQALLKACGTLTNAEKAELRAWAWSQSIGTKPSMWTEEQVNKLADWIAAKKRKE